MSDVESEQTVECGVNRTNGRGYQYLTLSIGFCIACILTVAFMPPLTAASKIAVCCFAECLPVFILCRLESDDTDDPVFKPVFSETSFGAVLFIHYAVMLIGFTALLFAIYWLAGWVFMATVLIAVTQYTVVYAKLNKRFSRH